MIECGLIRGTLTPYASLSLNIHYKMSPSSQSAVCATHLSGTYNTLTARRLMLTDVELTSNEFKPDLYTVMKERL